MVSKIRLQNVGFFFIIIFYLVSCISKPAMNIAAAFSLITSFFYIYFYNRNFISQKRFILMLLLPFFAGAVLSLFSERFLTGPLMFMNRHKFMLLFIPLLLFADTKKKFSILLAAAVISGLCAIFYGAIHGSGLHYARFTGPLKIGRTADMMMMLSLMMVSIVFSFDNKKMLFKIILFVFSLLFAGAMVLSGIRGAFVGYLFGIASFIIITPKKRLALCLSAFIVVLLYNVPGLKQDINSIAEIKNNVSNSTRIQLLKTGLEYIYDGNDILFGVGAENSEESYKAFILSHDKHYQDKNRYTLNHSRDFHNSYLQILIECGVVFLLLFLSGLFFLIFQLYRSLKSAEKDTIPIIKASIVVPVAFLVSQVFHSELYSYGASLFYLALYGGCLASYDFINQSKFLNLLWSRIER